MKELVNLIKTSFKLIGVIVLMITCLIAAIIFWNFHQEQKITMISIECDWESLTEKRGYLIQNQRNSILPYGIYRGSHRLEKPSKEKIFLQHELTDYSDEFYYFGITEKDVTSVDQGYMINRKNLDIFWWSSQEWHEGKCREISDEDFYKNISKKIEEKNSSVIF